MYACPPVNGTLDLSALVWSSEIIQASAQVLYAVLVRYPIVCNGPPWNGIWHHCLAL